MAKMTREEAIELLKNRKVYVNGKSAEIQKKLFKLGWKWSVVCDRRISCTGSPFLYIYGDFRFAHGTDMIEFTNNKHKEISAEEIISIEVVESLKENDVVSCGFKKTEDNPDWISVVKSGHIQRYNYKVALMRKGIYCDTLYFDAYSDLQAFCRPATEEEKQKLIDALKTSEDSRAKEILKEVFGIEEKPECPFKPFDKVLVRFNNDPWNGNFFMSYNSSNSAAPFSCLYGNWQQCIPYEGNEHLLKNK